MPLVGFETTAKTVHALGRAAGVIIAHLTNKFPVFWSTAVSKETIASPYRQPERICLSDKFKYFLPSTCSSRSRDSAVGIATGYVLGDRGVDSNSR
jgi:hypothetical protein